MVHLLVFNVHIQEGCFDEKMGHKNTPVRAGFLFLAGLTLKETGVSENQMLGAHQVLKLHNLKGLVL